MLYQCYAYDIAIGLRVVSSRVRVLLTRYVVCGTWQLVRYVVCGTQGSYVRDNRLLVIPLPYTLIRRCKEYPHTTQDDWVSRFLLKYII